MDEIKGSSNEVLQNLIGRAIQEQKALLCLVFDDQDVSRDWETKILDLRHYKKLKETTLCVKMSNNSPQAQLLNAVCPISSTPSVIIVQQGQVIGNFQNGQPSGRLFTQEICKRYRLSEEEIQSTIDAEEPFPEHAKGFIELPPSSGRMRLPNNAYDKLRKVTNEYRAQGLKGIRVAEIQMNLLTSSKSDAVATAALALKTETSEEEVSKILPEDLVNKLLNSPPSILNDNIIFSTSMDSDHDEPYAMYLPNTSVEEQPRTSSTSPSQIDTPPLANSSSRTNSNPVGNSTQAGAVSSSQENTRRAESNHSPVPQPSSNSNTTSQTSQRTDYIRQQREREASQKAERERIKAQIKADRDARREAEASRKAAETQSELEALRKANSTTASPKSSDVRVQVRTFDGSTIKTTFPRSATISANVRPWVDTNREGKEPYDLKLILTPLPNRNIEAAEEGQQLSELGISGSCTMVMVPVKGFVESYTGDTSTGLIGSAVSGGYNIVSGAAGMLFGGVKSFLGGSGGSAGAESAAQQRQASTPTTQSGPSSAPGNVKVRTLADQRIEDAKKKGNQLYNGNQLNFEPRKDDDDDENRKND